ncbi:MAG: response regulator [Opitutaceae bacterium]|nr:response regulator [Opitutaceae bacterium]
MSNARTVVPAAGAVAPNTAAEPPPQRPVALLIEDDECVADVVATLLGRHGYQVVRAADGAQGAQQFATYEREIAVVILDCGLPDVDGASLCRVLRRIAPKLPIVLTSGWETVAARALIGEGPTVFLQKPFFPVDVMRAVNAFRAVKT